MGVAWQTRRVLIVDPDDEFRFWAAGSFRQKPVARVISSPSPSAARAILCDNPVDVALLDLSTDEAIELIRWLRLPGLSPAPDLPLVVMAAVLDRRQLHIACTLGIHGVLKKPVSSKAMLDAVAAVLTKPSRLVWQGGDDEPGEAASAAGRPPVRLRGVAGPAAARVLEISPPPVGRPTAGVPATTVGGGFVETVKPVAPQSRPLPVGSPVEPADAVPPAAVPQGIELVRGKGARVPATTVGGGFAETVEPVAPQSGSLPVESPVEPADASLSAAVPQGIELVRGKGAGRPPARSIEDILAGHASWVGSLGNSGQRANLEGEDLSGLSLSGAVLNSALLRRCDLTGSDLGGASLPGADLRHARLNGANLAGCNLALARLRHASLCGCRLDGANLKGADLAGADFSAAVLGEADLTGAILLAANFSQADLSSVAGLTQAQLQDAVGDAHTRLGPGLYLVQPEGIDG